MMMTHHHHLMVCHHHVKRMRGSDAVMQVVRVLAMTPQARAASSVAGTSNVLALHKQRQ
jgi:hypothetical protein